LLTLIEAQGAIVGKQALIESVWPDRIVEENNLVIQMSMPRKALGADRGLIRTVAGQGYRFTGERWARSRCPLTRGSSQPRQNRRPRPTARSRTCLNRFPN
jgi:DNA-binding winged helix-turn-helix (wHTH) protein